MLVSKTNISANRVLWRNKNVIDVQSRKPTIYVQTLCGPQASDALRKFSIVVPIPFATFSCAIPPESMRVIRALLRKKRCTRQNKLPNTRTRSSPKPSWNTVRPGDFGRRLVTECCRARSEKQRNFVLENRVFRCRKALAKRFGLGSG